MPPFHGIWISLFQILLFSWSSCRDGAGRRRSHGASPPFLISSSGTIPRVETRGNNHTGQRAAGKRRLEPSPSSPLVLLCKSQLCQAVNSPKPSGSPPLPFLSFSSPSLSAAPAARREAKEERKGGRNGILPAAGGWNEDGLTWRDDGAVPGSWERRMEWIICWESTARTCKDGPACAEPTLWDEPKKSILGMGLWELGLRETLPALPSFPSLKVNIS